MSSEENLFEEFAEDFFAESNDHVTGIRRALLAMEEAAHAGAPLAPDLVTAVTRSLHTLKGLCGMVGLAGASAVAHAAEETVRLAVGRAGPVDGEAVEKLLTAVRALDSCLSARRARTSEPDVAPVVAELRAYAAPFADTPADDPRAGAGRSYRFTFAPSPALAARGVSVEVVRTRLQALGEVAAVTPRVTTSGSIVFEFVVVANEGSEPLEHWREDGIDWEQLGNAVKAPEAPLADAAAGLPRSALVRVDLARLDELMLLLGELVISRARLADGLTRLRTDRSNAAFGEVEDANELIERQLRDLRAAVMRVRLVPVGEVFERMRFVARDVARNTGRLVRVEVEGGSTEIDKIVVERMLEPLLHLVRNAIGHGLETPAERTAAGKDPTGRVALRAASAGDTIVIQVEDDGRGVAVEAVRAAARAGGVASEALARDDVLELLCLPGVSTQASANLTSGRGVGMEVVRKTIAEVGGELSLETQSGSGTRFTIRLPLTLMIVDALLVTIADQTVAVPQPSLREVLRIEPEQITSFENNEIIKYRDGILPIVRLRSVFGHFALENGVASHVLVVGDDPYMVGLLVDRVIGLREIVVRSIADPLVTVPGVAGAAELGDGRVSLILDAGGLARWARDRKSQSVRSAIPKGRVS